MCCGNIFSKNTVIIILFFLISLSLINQVFNKPQPSTIKETKIITISPTNTKSELVKVARVIDGDTIEIETGQKVRYIGIDAPELHHPKKPVQCFAKEAYEFNRQLVEGKMIKLEKDVSETDKYGRLLRYVFLEDKQATLTVIFINQYLVSEGYAYASTFPPDVKYAEVFRQEQEKARNNKKGLWEKCL